jgi:AmiR/NasT family two-component response regulator
VNHAVLKEAIRLGARALVVGGIDDRDLRDILG